MNFSPLEPGSGPAIQAYAPGQIRIAGKIYRRSLILAPDFLHENWGPSCVAELRPEHVRALLACEAQILIIGTGARQVFPEPALYACALDHGIGVEIMDTGAACRTYNLVMGEGRRIVAGLMIEAVSS